MIDADSAAGGVVPGFIAGAFTMADVEQVQTVSRSIELPYVLAKPVAPLNVGYLGLLHPSTLSRHLQSSKL